MADYEPLVIDSFQQLANTGAVEFLGETNYHSMAFLTDREEFIEQVNQHARKMMQLTGMHPLIFRNTELMYSNAVAETVYELGFKGMFLDGVESVLKGRSTNRLYRHPEVPLVLFPRNYRLSDDIAFRYSDRSWDEWPLSAEKYVKWIEKQTGKSSFVSLGMDYETFGEHQKAHEGIHDFLREFIVRTVDHSHIQFINPTEALKLVSPRAIIATENVISWADKQKDLSAWLGNDLQRDAFHSLNKLFPLIENTRNSALLQDFRNLQTADHFYYMSTQGNDDGMVHQYFSPYSSPYEAFMNYMNVLADLEWRLKHERSYANITEQPEETEVPDKYEDLVLADA